jgi:ArsR family transcriptional regulator
MTRNPPSDAEAFAQRLRALAHPMRLKILAALAASKTCQCGEIVRDLPLAQSTVSEHLRILREAGFVQSTGEGARSCYCLDRSAMHRLAGEFDRLLAAIGAQEGPRPNMRTRRKPA